LVPWRAPLDFFVVLAPLAALAPFLAGVVFFPDLASEGATWGFRSATVAFVNLSVQNSSVFHENDIDQGPPCIPRRGIDYPDYPAGARGYRAVDQYARVGNFLDRAG
jgi:hypothetical protein